MNRSIKTIKLDDLSADTVAQFGVVRLDLRRQLPPQDLVALARRIGRPHAFSLQKYRPEGFPPEVTLLDASAGVEGAAPRGFGEGWHQDSTDVRQNSGQSFLYFLAAPAANLKSCSASTGVA